MDNAATLSEAALTRRVGVALAIGILLAPYIFAWFLLRRGYSAISRLISFAWMVIVLVAFASSSGSDANRSGQASSPKSFGAIATDAIVDPQMNAITDKVARDAVDQYNIAKSGGDKIQTCVQAQLVSAAYLQAKDQANYLLWKQVERNDCHDAGLAQP